MLKPIQVKCPTCFSEAGELCTQPDDRSRHYVKTFHMSRETQAMLAEWKQDA